MSIIAWIIVGCMAGLSASGGVVERRRGVHALDAVLGAAGALAGGIVFQTLGSPSMPALDIRSGLVWAVGALILLATTSISFSTRQQV